VDLTHHSVQERNGCLTLAPFFLELFIFNLDYFFIPTLNKPFPAASLVVPYISSVPKIILSFLLSAKLNQHYLHQIPVLKISEG
jgi:hypothetical protein